MGAALVIRVFESLPEPELRARVEECRQSDGYEDGYSYSGSWGTKHGLTINRSKVFPTVMAAEEHIEAVGDKDRPLLAVPAHRVPKNTPVPAKVEKLQERHRAAAAAVAEFPRTVIARVRAAKRKTRSCAHCHSSISTEYLRAPECPVCHQTFLYGPADVERLKKLSDRTEDLAAALRQAADDQRQDLVRRGAIETVWVVGGWCRS